MASKSATQLLRPLQKCTSGGRAARGLRRDTRHACPAGSSGMAAAALDNGDSLLTSGENVHKPAATKSMNDLPGPTGWPVVGNFLTYLKKENVGQLHKVQMSYHKKYGGIFREKWGPQWQVHIGDPDLAAEVYRNQGRYPHRPAIPAWILYRQVTNTPLGVITSQGEEWHRIRTAVDKRLLCPHTVTEYSSTLNAVAADLVKRLRELRDTEGEKPLTGKLGNLAYLWAAECVAAVLFERRLGCLNREIPEESQTHIDSIDDMQKSSLPLLVGERIHEKLNTRFWQRHKNAWDQIMSAGSQMVEDTYKQLQEKLEAGQKLEDLKTGFLPDLLLSGKLSLAEVSASLCEIVLAATDTAANALCFLLHCIATHPEAQARLYEEIVELGTDGQLAETAIPQMRYLDCCIKESMRLYPGVTMQVRILEDSLVLQGHQIPKGTSFVINHFAIGHNEKYFPEPEKFLPERWIRDENNRGNYHPFASLPFGYGTRRCIGQRIGKLQLNLAVVQILRSFELQKFDGLELEPTLRTMLSPGEVVPVRFVER